MIPTGSSWNVSLQSTLRESLHRFSNPDIKYHAICLKTLPKITAFKAQARILIRLCCEPELETTDGVLRARSFIDRGLSGKFFNPSEAISHRCYFKKKKQLDPKQRTGNETLYGLSLMMSLQSMRGMNSVGMPKHGKGVTQQVSREINSSSSAATNCITRHRGHLRA